MFVLTTKPLIEALPTILSEIFVPLDSEDPTGEPAAGWIVGIILVLPTVLGLWAFSQAFTWAVPFLDARELLALRRMDKQAIHKGEQTMMYYGNWRDGMSEETVQESDTEPNYEGRDFCVDCKTHIEQ